MPSAYGLLFSFIVFISHFSWSSSLEIQKVLPSNIIKVPLVRQVTEYSCGAAALASILHYYKVFDGIETDLHLRLKTTAENGTQPQMIAKVAQEFGLRATWSTGLSILDLQDSLTNKEVVILNIQAWRDEKEAHLPWSNVWEAGHYVVLVAMDKGGVFVMDPSLSGQYGYIPLKEFQSRWHDYEIDEFGKRQNNYQLGIVLKSARETLNPNAAKRVE